MPARDSAEARGPDARGSATTTSQRRGAVRRIPARCRASSSSRGGRGAGRASRGPPALVPPGRRRPRLRRDRSRASAGTRAARRTSTTSRRISRPSGRRWATASRSRRWSGGASSCASAASTTTRSGCSCCRPPTAPSMSPSPPCGRRCRPTRTNPSSRRCIGRGARLRQGVAGRATLGLERYFGVLGRRLKYLVFFTR